MSPIVPSQLLPSLTSFSVSLSVMLLLLTAPLALLLTAALGCVLPRILPRSAIGVLPILGLSVLVAWLALGCRELTTTSILGMWILFLVSAAAGGVAEMLNVAERRDQDRQQPKRQAVLPSEVLLVHDHDLRPAYVRTRYEHARHVPANRARQATRDHNGLVLSDRAQV